MLVVFVSEIEKLSGTPGGQRIANGWPAAFSRQISSARNRASTSCFKSAFPPTLAIGQTVPAQLTTKRSDEPAREGTTHPCVFILLVPPPTLPTKTSIWRYSQP